MPRRIKFHVYAIKIGMNQLKLYFHRVKDPDFVLKECPRTEFPCIAHGDCIILLRYKISGIVIGIERKKCLALPFRFLSTVG